MTNLVDPASGDPRGIDPDTIATPYGKAAEYQRRGVIHLHAIMRLDGRDPDAPKVVLPCPAGLTADDLKDAIEHAARVTRFTTDSHPTRPAGWVIAWGEQIETKVITIDANAEITDDWAARYIAKYATKSTEVTGHDSGRLTEITIDLYADPDGNHPERLLDACWTLGRPREWRQLRRWTHMLGFGGHVLTKSRTFTATFRYKRQQRTLWRRRLTTGPEAIDGQVPEQETTLVVNFLQFVGAGWHTTEDAALANQSAALAREHHEQARAEQAASTR